MNGRRAFFLMLFGALALALGISVQPKPDLPPAESGQLAYPGLATQLGSAVSVEINGGGKSVTLMHQGDDASANWVVAERGGYPADARKLRSVLVALGELRLYEPRTVDPSLYARLGVNNPQAEGATSTGIVVTDRVGRIMASLIVGHRGVRARPGAPEQIYIRRTGEKNAWLAEGSLDVSPDPLAWLQRGILDIKADQIASVEIHRDGTTLSLRRGKDGKLALDTPPAGKLDDIRPIEVSQALDALTLVDVGSDALPGKPVGSVQYVTTDTQKVTVLLSQDSDHLWARLAASGVSPDKMLLLANHVFELPSWRLDEMLPKAADFLKADPKK